MSDPQPSYIHVERGNPSAEELAVLTVVLLARTSLAAPGPGDACVDRRAVARWRRPERANGFDSPRSWCRLG